MGIPKHIVRRMLEGEPSSINMQDMINRVYMSPVEWIERVKPTTAYYECRVVYPKYGAKGISEIHTEIDADVANSSFVTLHNILKFKDIKFSRPFTLPSDKVTFYVYTKDIPKLKKKVEEFWQDYFPTQYLEPHYDELRASRRGEVSIGAATRKFFHSGAPWLRF